MKKYRQLADWETPFDGDILIIKDPVYSSKDNTFRTYKHAYRVSRFRNSCMTAFLTDCRNNKKHICVVNNSQIIKAFRAV